MKKVFVLLLCAAVSLCTFSVRAEMPPHEHEIEYIEEIPAKCEEDGRLSHYRCAVCGMVFSDPDGNEVITDPEQLVIPATGHDWGEWITVTEPTGTEPGLRRRFCKNTPAGHVLVVTLDPGHGYYDNQGYYKEYYEGRRMFILMSYLADELETYSNVVVYKTRHDIRDEIPLAERGKMAAENGSELFISLHSNWYTDPEASGVSVYRSFIRPESEELGSRLGLAVTEVINGYTGEAYMRNDGLPMIRTEPAYGPEYGDGVTQDYYNVIRASVMSDACRYSYIIEHGFHSNPDECAFLMSDENLFALAQAEADVIADYFGLYREGDENAPEVHVQYEEIPPVTPAILEGDVNGDGAVNNKDVMALFGYLSGEEIEVIEDALDVNGDGERNNKDIIYLFKAVSGAEKTEE